MKLYEKNLNKIIRAISEYGIVTNVEIENSSITITPPTTPKKKESKILEIDLNRANKFKVSFLIADRKINMEDEDDNRNTHS